MTIEDLKKLLKELGATEETTSDGITFIELDSKNYKPQGSSSKPQATSHKKEQVD